MILLHGVFTLTAPFHTSAGSKGLRLQRDGRVAHKDSEGIPVISTVTSPITVRGQFHGDLPVVPSTAVIGRLRKLAARRVRAALTADTKPLTSAVYYALANGIAPGKQIGNTFSLEELQRVQGDLFFGIFGGGSMRYAARYAIGDLYPVTSLTIDAGLVPPKFSDLAPQMGGRDLEPWQLFHYPVVRRIDDLARGRDSAAGVEYTPAAEDGAGREAAVAFQAIPAGTSMYLRCSIDAGTTDAQRGLLLLALKDLVVDQKLGGRAHHGWGGFTAQRFRLINGKERVDLFDLSYDDEGLVVLKTTRECDRLCAAAEKALAAVAKAPAKAREQLRTLLDA